MTTLGTSYWKEGFIFPYRILTESTLDTLKTTALGTSF